MGLYITHHHAEPLGAEMFARKFPDLNASYDEHSDKFIKLWKEGIENQKDYKVVWNLGFRGQGDSPFWEQDPKYDTMESRGALISRLIKMQYDLVKAHNPNDSCCTNLYGEIMELYQRGYLELPKDVIKIWADNGFGKMVSRRQGNHNPRVPALPQAADNGRNGIYYHVSFYDLQAANHMTMLPNKPEFVQGELSQVMQLGCSDYWIINCSNIKPHTYYLDFISEFWREGTISVEEHRKNYVIKYFGKENTDIIVECIARYFEAAVPYGPNEDDHAGEQFTNHVPRMLITQFIKDNGKRADDLLWMSDAPDLKGQLEGYHQHCRQGVASYEEYLMHCKNVCGRLTRGQQTFFKDSLLLQAKLHSYCFQGAEYVCRSLEAAFGREYQKAFYLAGRARECYLHADHVMRKREHGKWHNFYANECLTDIKQTAWVLEGLMSYLRCLGDGPHYYRWQRDFLYSPKDREVMLLLNTENHLTDHEIFELMKASEQFSLG